MYYKEFDPHTDFRELPIVEAGIISSVAETATTPDDKERAESVIDGSSKFTVLGKDSLLITPGAECMTDSDEPQLQVAEVVFGDIDDHSDANVVRVLDISTMDRVELPYSKTLERVVLPDGTSVNVVKGASYLLEMDVPGSGDEESGRKPITKHMSLGDGETLFGKSNKGSLAKFEDCLTSTIGESDLVFHVDSSTRSLTITSGNETKGVRITTESTTGEIKTPEEIAELSAKRDGKAILDASGVLPPATGNTVDEIFNKAGSRKLFKIGDRIENAKIIQEARSAERLKSAIKVEQALYHQRGVLEQAKQVRATARLSHNRFTQYLKKHELRGEKLRELKKSDRYEKAGIFKRASLRGVAKELASNEARNWRVNTRTDVRQAVKDARGEIAKTKATKRDLSEWRRKGGTNGFRENYKLAREGFSIGEYSAYDRMTDDQKQKLRKQMEERIRGARSDRHNVRGRRSTRKAANKTT